MIERKVFGIHAIIQNTSGIPIMVAVYTADEWELFAPPHWEFGYDDCVLVKKQGDEQMRILNDEEIDELKKTEE